MKPTNEIHTRAQSLMFRGKVSLLQLRRVVKDVFDAQIKQFAFTENPKEKPIIAESKMPLWTESKPEEQFLLAGKVHNLRLAVKRINGNVQAVKNIEAGNAEELRNEINKFLIT